MISYFNVDPYVVVGVFGNRFNTSDCRRSGRVVCSEVHISRNVHEYCLRNECNALVFIIYLYIAINFRLFYRFVDEKVEKVQ